MNRALMILSEKQRLFAENIAHLIQEIIKNGYGVTFGEAYRTPEQAAIYAKEGKGISDSLHCKRLAIDLNLFNDQGDYITEYNEYKQFGQYWKTLNSLHRWGGDFVRLVDSNHFEMQDL
jgi:hypothetical protein